jgi:hypothetical protein
VGHSCSYQKKKSGSFVKIFQVEFFLCSLSSIVVLLFYSPTYFSRFDQSTKEKILAFILGSALKLSDYGKVCSLSVILYFMHEELL